MDIQEFGKGALTQPVALKDFRLEAIPTAVVLPKNFEIVYGGRIKNQNGSGSCVAQACAYYAEVLNFKETKQWVNLSPKFVYSQTHQNPTGSYIKDAMGCIRSKGICEEIYLPSYDNGNPPSDAFMQRREDITADAYENAFTYIAKSYVTWDNTKLEKYKRAIIEGSGCVVASWGNNYCWGIGMTNGMVLLPAYRSQMVWQHGIYLIGYNDEKKEFKFINSWGLDWGFSGYGYLPYEYVTQGYVSNPMTMIDMSNQVYSIKKQLVGLMLNVIELLKEKIANYKR